MLPTTLTITTTTETTTTIRIITTRLTIYLSMDKILSKAQLVEQKQI